MLPTFVADPRVELIAACDPRQEARAQFATDFGAPAYASIEELAGDGAVDAIYIASPHQFHAEHTRTAADHGKHVLVEKPMALSLAECDSMIESCRHARVQLIVGHSHSFDTPYLKAREIVQSGELGAVKMIHALNYTEFLYRPRRPEELSTDAGGGVVFSQAAHQIDVVRLLAASRVVRVRAITGEWDKTRPTEGAYSALLWFECGAFASLVYSGYAHFDSDEWCGWIGEMGAAKNKDQYGAARARLLGVESAAEEARLKSAATYGGVRYQPASAVLASQMHQHFGSVIVSCERGDLQPLPDSIVVYGNDRREVRALAPPAVPRFEVIDELYVAVVKDESPLHDGASARATLQVCLAMLQSAREQRDIKLAH